jgi:transposase
MRTSLPKAAAVPRTLKAQLVHLLTYFRNAIPNFLTEGFISKIQAIKDDASGFRRFADYRYRILFFCGKLDLRFQLPLSAANTIP